MLILFLPPSLLQVLGRLILGANIHNVAVATSVRIDSEMSSSGLANLFLGLNRPLFRKAAAALKHTTMIGI
jgi:hypothetical protein